MAVTWGLSGGHGCHQAPCGAGSGQPRQCTSRHPAGVVRLTRSVITHQARFLGNRQAPSHSGEVDTLAPEATGPTPLLRSPGGVSPLSRLGDTDQEGRETNDHPGAQQSWGQNVCGLGSKGHIS